MSVPSDNIDKSNAIMEYWQCITALDRTVAMLPEPDKRTPEDDEMYIFFSALKRKYMKDIYKILRNLHGQKKEKIKLNHDPVNPYSQSFPFAFDILQDATKMQAANCLVKCPSCSTFAKLKDYTVTIFIEYIFLIHTPCIKNKIQPMTDINGLYTQWIYSSVAYYDSVKDEERLFGNVVNAVNLPKIKIAIKENTKLDTEAKVEAAAPEVEKSS